MRRGVRHLLVTSSRPSSATVAPTGSTPVRVFIPGNHLVLAVLGHRDEHLRLVERAFPSCQIVVRGNEIAISGVGAPTAGKALEEVIVLVQAGLPVDATTVSRTIDMVRADERPSEILQAEVFRGGGGRTIRPKTSGQRRYADAIGANTITIATGPAGSGKSYLAVALAVQALVSKQVQRIILTRPAVEAGERLGFLPGDLMAKIDPYLRPLYDALFDMLEPDGVARLMEKGLIEVAPLAFMRGRTLNNSFIILDEAQNTTPEQMKMFLTRIGFGSKAVITGDLTQVDLAGGRGGLAGLEELLGEIEGLSFIHLGRADVVRHRIVADIVDAYDRHDLRKQQAVQRAPETKVAGTSERTEERT